VQTKEAEEKGGFFGRRKIRELLLSESFAISSYTARG
jgi:hypothetical protein